MKKLVCLLLTALCLLNTVSAANMAADVAGYLVETVATPKLGTIGGEWTVLGLARGNMPVPDDYYDKYYHSVCDTLKQNGGVIHEVKYTEYSRLILGLTAAGYDPRDVAGYDLTEFLSDYDKVIWQGVNGPIYALLALDCKNYDIPVSLDNVTVATREMYVQRILSQQNSDGGFSLNGQLSNADITAMAVQALAKYDSPQVVTAVNRALTCLSLMQDDMGGFADRGESNLESIAQVIVALCELGIAIDDSRFVKNGNSPLDALTRLYDGKGFAHSANGAGEGVMSTEQGLYALVSIQRLNQGKTSLYRMTDVEFKTPTVKNEKAFPIITFDDIQQHPNQSAIEWLAARGFINGKGGSKFEPDATMTRAEFAAIVVRCLGLELQTENVFTDVSIHSWYKDYVSTAYYNNIVTGTDAKSFVPNGTITKEQAAVMTARAAQLLGLETNIAKIEADNLLAQFDDYKTVSDWAYSSMAFCYKNNLLSQAELEITPKNAIKRCEIAQMLYMLVKNNE